MAPYSQALVAGEKRRSGSQSLSITGPDTPNDLPRPKATFGAHVGPIPVLPAASEGLPISMVVESMSIHAAAEVVEWPERKDMGFHFLPTYSPKLNPAELVRSLVKGAVGKQFVKTKSELKKRIVEQFDALRAVPEKVQMVFHEPDCNYIVSCLFSLSTLFENSVGPSQPSLLYGRRLHRESRSGLK